MKREKMRHFGDWLKEKLGDPKFREGYRDVRMAVVLGHKIHPLREWLGLAKRPKYLQVERGASTQPL